jgi:hypothetical protein
MNGHSPRGRLLGIAIALVPLSAIGSPASLGNLLASTS